MSKSSESDRVAVLDALEALRADNALPLRVDCRSKIREALNLETLSNSRLIKTLQSLHYKYGGVVVYRFGSSDGGMQRGWHIDLTHATMRRDCS